MFKLLALALVQSALLASIQVTLKLSLQQIGAFSWSWAFFARALTCVWFAVCGICYALSTVLWLYILKHYPLSQAYPLISLSYVMGMRVYFPRNRADGSLAGCGIYYGRCGDGELSGMRE